MSCCMALTHCGISTEAMNLSKTSASQQYPEHLQPGRHHIPPFMRISIITRLLIMLAASGLTVSTALADTPVPNPSQPLTLIQLTDLALTNNPATKLAWASIRSGEAGLELARAGYWPDLTVSYNLQRLREVGLAGTTSPNETVYGPDISLSYLLWDFGVRSGTVDAAKFSLMDAHLSGDQTMQDLILTVEQDYYQVLGLDALQNADAQSLKDAEANYDAANQRKVSGLATLGDVYQAEAALAGAKLALQTAQGQLAVARGTLAVAVGYSADTTLALAPWEQNVTPQLPPQGMQELLDEARKARPELLAVKASEQSAVANLEATQGRGWPTLGLSADAGRTSTRITGQTTTANNYTAGLTLSFPLFTGFANEAANRQAQAAVDTAQATSEQLMQQVELEVWQAYQNMLTAAATVETSETQLKSAQEAADVTSARYKNGLDTILDVLTAQATLANARVQQIQARLNWFTALDAMGHSVGGLTAPKDAPELP